ncbi:MAG TPA: chemotaxis response regulator protein-glutamate methylesterase [Candidatus Eisenbergiella merdipullorum]|uniref:Protein-glutamate methylesterase/protein-glutamine glutaminase n=1 Tax=Candidatus Eisenbergiella merdipullorum TaxID=2838553 RepID=A0A9D2L089_9FIRM|nr:chemotaxis response regulator protein-glutamate methylesterase [Candidatus Eisenbergiella merdipullorum]
MRDQALNILVVDDSLVFCRFLTSVIPTLNPRFHVMGYALNTTLALQAIRRQRPDIITMDVEMPGENGIDFLKRLLPEYPIPVILVSSLNMNVLEALSCGAVDFLRKPDMSAPNSRENFTRQLLTKLLIASRAHVRCPFAIPPAGSKMETEGKTGRTSPFSAWQLPDASPFLDRTIIAIGASTGGTEATLEVLRRLPANTPGIVVTQHMPEGFTAMYAQRLDRLCQMKVKEAVNGDRIRRGQVLIAPGNQQMRVVRVGNTYTVSCFAGQKVNGHRPSVDVLFDSMASSAASDGIGIILTGMGSDGAKGLLKMRQAGAYTIGQDKASCVVYGMPMVANDIGAVAIQASCSNIPNVLLNFLKKNA